MRRYRIVECFGYDGKSAAVVSVAEDVRVVIRDGRAFVLSDKESHGGTSPDGEWRVSEAFLGAPVCFMREPCP